VSVVRRIGDGDDAVIVHAVAPYAGRARDLIKALKYDGRLEHARDLGHLLFKHLDRRWERHELDRVVANPTYQHRGVRHTEWLLAAMAAADTERRWVFDDPTDPCLSKARPTVAAYGRDARGHWTAAAAMERALVVRHPELVEGRQVLVIDDVVTTGAQLQAVARVLRGHGATDVHGLVVATVDSPVVDLTSTVDDVDHSTERAAERLERLGRRPTDLGGLSL